MRLHAAALSGDLPGIKPFIIRLPVWTVNQGKAHLACGPQEVPVQTEGDIVQMLCKRQTADSVKMVL